MKEMKRAEREDMRRDGWMVLESDGNLNFDVKVVVPDLNSNLSESERADFEKALAKMKEKLAEKKPDEAASADRRDSQDAGKAPPVSSNSSSAPSTNTPAVIADDDPEFVKYFEIFSNPSLTEEEELSYIKTLIKQSKSGLVRKLVSRLASVPGAGKSVMFKALAKKLAQKSAPVVSQAQKDKSSEGSEDAKKPADSVSAGEGSG